MRVKGKWPFTLANRTYYLLYSTAMTSPGTAANSDILGAADIEEQCRSATAALDLDGKRVLVLVPDHTRTCPLPEVFGHVYDSIVDRVAHLDVMVALGTHPPMTEEHMCSLFGITPAEKANRYPEANFHNHMWKDPDQLTEFGRFTREEVGEVSGGLFEMDVSVKCNRIVEEQDMVLIIGPVFPHEVVGFSGGNKYIIPGIAGQEIIDFLHWLGAVITNPEIIGSKYTPVRAVVDKAAAFMPVERQALCMVVKGTELAGLFAGTPEEAWSAAADLSARIHIEERPRSYHTVLSCAPEMYDDLWTGGKCMYKIEPVVSDGGKVIIYAPHITEISVTHGEVIREIGYHTRDFFREQWDKYQGYPWGVLAHSTHVKGIGSYEDGVEKPRIDVILATGIPEDVCREVNLGYMDPATINKADFDGREDEGILCVHKAGETLYRLRG